MMPSEAQEINHATVDAADAWEKFAAAWPFDPVDFRRAAAKAEFAKLTDSERESAIVRAPSFIKAWRHACRGPLPSARKWLREKGWESVKRPPSSSTALATPADHLPDGRWRLHPGSLQLQRWHEHERRTLGRARLGLTRPSEWPPDIGAATDARDRSTPCSCRSMTAGPSRTSRPYGQAGPANKPVGLRKISVDRLTGLPRMQRVDP